jgi:hypothetical protein
MEWKQRPDGRYRYLGVRELDFLLFFILSYFFFYRGSLSIEGNAPLMWDADSVTVLPTTTTDGLVRERNRERQRDRETEKRARERRRGEER